MCAQPTDNDSGESEVQESTQLYLLFIFCATFIRMLYQIDVGAPPKFIRARSLLCLRKFISEILDVQNANSDLLGAGVLKIVIYCVGISSRMYLTFVL
jgi:hypothetical protein